RHKGGALGQKAPEALVGQQHRAQMQQQVEEVVSERVLSPGLVVQPEGEVSERARLSQTPNVQPTPGRGQNRVRENGIIVKMKARTERSPKSGQRRGEQKKARSHDSLRACAQRPKTAAERQARVAELLRRLEQLYPAATCALQHRNPWELLVATILS